MWSGLPPNLQKDPLTVSIIFYDTLIFIPLFSCIIIKNEHCEASLILSYIHIYTYKQYCAILLCISGFRASILS